MEQERNEMGQASMVLGIMSILGICCCYGGFIFGSLAVLFALLSKTEEKLGDQARIGMITGVIGLGISLILVIGIFGLGMAHIALESTHIVHGGGMHI